MKKTRRIEKRKKNEQEAYTVPVWNEVDAVQSDGSFSAYDNSQLFHSENI